MSHSLATCLPPDFLSGHPPYDFASSSSTESESDEDELAGLTRRFTRSVSFQERLNIPLPAEKKRGFLPTQARSSPTTPFGQPSQDSWELVYAAAREVARMKLKANAVNNAVNDAVFGNKGLLGAPLSHNHYLPNSATWSENEEFFRQQLLRRRVTGGVNYDCGGRCGSDGAVGFRQPAWPLLPGETHRRQQPPNVFAGRFSNRAVAGVKKERSGTGVFLPRNYSNIPPDSNKKPACSPTHLPAVVAQPFNKNMGSIIARPQGPQAPVHGGIGPQYQVPPSPYHFNRGELAELVMARRNAVMLAQQRQSMVHVGVPETRMGPPEVVLPQEWTY